MRDLPKIVGDTPIGKDVPVVVIRKGKEETKTVRLGRLRMCRSRHSVKTEAPVEDNRWCRRRSASASRHERRAARRSTRSRRP